MLTLFLTQNTPGRNPRSETWPRMRNSALPTALRAERQTLLLHRQTMSGDGWRLFIGIRPSLVVGQNNGLTNG